MCFSVCPARLFMAALFTLILAFPLSNVEAKSADPQALVLKSNAVFQSFMADADMVWFHENIGKARAVFIVPQMLRGGFIVGGSGGSGVLLAREEKTGFWTYPAFYTMGSMSIGLQVGTDTSEIVLMVMTEKGFNAMLSTEFKLGADVTVAAGPIGASTRAQTADVLAFGRSKGVVGGVSIEGAVISPRDKWNEAYYGKPVGPVDILVRHAVTNPQADQLRSTQPSLGQ